MANFPPNPPYADSSEEDTQPRPPITFPPPPEASPAPSGCGNSLLILTVLFVLFGICITTVGIAAFAGWRDGGVARRTQQAAAIGGTLDRQATLAWGDIGQQSYELGLARCEYISTLQPFYPNVPLCIATAQAGLNATPTPSPAPPTPTPPPAPTTAPIVAPTPGSANTGGISTDDLWARAQTAMQQNDTESAVAWLESLRALDVTYRRQEVEDMLINGYIALGTNYRNTGRLAEMVVVIRKALRIRPLAGTDWEFTVNATELYLSARNHYDGGNYALAAQVFARLMEIAPAYLDTKTLACRAFQAAGDSASLGRFCS